MDNGMEWSRGDVLGGGSFATVSLAFVHEPCQWQLPSVVAVKSAPLSLSGSLRHEYSVLGELQGCRQIVRCFGDEVRSSSMRPPEFSLITSYSSSPTVEASKTLSAAPAGDSGSRPLDDTSSCRTYTMAGDSRGVARGREGFPAAVLYQGPGAAVEKISGEGCRTAADEDTEYDKV